MALGRLGLGRPLRATLLLVGERRRRVFVGEVVRRGGLLVTWPGRAFTPAGGVVFVRRWSALVHGGRLPRDRPAVTSFSGPERRGRSRQPFVVRTANVWPLLPFSSEPTADTVEGPTATASTSEPFVGGVSRLHALPFQRAIRPWLPSPPNA